MRNMIRGIQASKLRKAKVLRTATTKLMPDARVSIPVTWKVNPKIKIGWADQVIGPSDFPHVVFG
jgi:hypothetical protein